MVIVHYIGIISACLAYWFSFYIIEQAYGSQWSFPNTEQCTSFEYFINEENEMHKMIFKLIKTIQQAKKKTKQKNRLSYQNFKNCKEVIPIYIDTKT